jgi:hypothetical protein
MSGDFDKLMGELQSLAADQGEMAKALPADDGKDEANIQAAAEEGGLDTGAVGAGEGGEGAAGEGEGEGEGAAPMAKSFKLTLEDGTEIEAQDGAEMVKALGDRLTSTETNMAKALGRAIDLIKGQADMMKSMQTQMAKLAGEGRGRKAVLSVVEKPAPGAAATTMAKSLAPEGMTPDVFFTKALAAQKEGRISGSDIAVAEASINRGEQVPAHIVQRVMA